MKLFILVCSMILIFMICIFSKPFSSLEILPVASQGRFMPLGIYAKNLINGYDDSKENTIELLLQMHMMGHKNWDDKPFFRNLQKEIISYNELIEAIQIDTNAILQPLIVHNFLEEYNSPSNPFRTGKVELQQLSQGLWVIFAHNEIEIGKKFNVDHNDSKSVDEITTLLRLINQYEQSFSSLFLLPSRYSPGEWLPLNLLATHVNNFTDYSDSQFNEIRSAYLSLQFNILGDHLLNAYTTIAGKIYHESANHSLSYPTINQLKAELFYFNAPLAIFSIIFYILALLCVSLSQTRLAIFCYLFGLAIHTCILGLRCYILARPPVSNMYETMVYVPWISSIIGLVLYLYSSKRSMLLAGAFSSCILLSLMKFTGIDGSFTPIQPVLNSQYWLIIHVLMVVGSYGIFILAGILGHIYLLRNDTIKAKYILYSLYLGTGLLIGGTILGGVWAAQSWGRFWDWDPKESWAFISSCIYLVIIHAHKFKKIDDSGLAIGSILGMAGISFTWYGVNYILGTGLHSYGFGSANNFYYYLYLGFEIMFLFYWYTGKFRLPTKSQI